MAEGFSLPSIRVIRVLNQLIEWRGKPSAIQCDNGPEFISHEFTGWAKKHDIRTEYIQPGKPQQNAYIAAQPDNQIQLGQQASVRNPGGSARLCNTVFMVLQSRTPP